MEIIKSTEDNINARCASCKYFAIGKFIHNTDSLDKKDKYCIVKDDNKSDFGICLNAKISSDYVNVWTERTPTQSTDGIYATCDDERAYLQVGKDFCCIHYDGAKELKYDI